MARKSKSEPHGWGICVDHLDGTFGWIVVGNGEPYIADSQAEAEKYMKKLLANSKYSYSCPLLVREYVLCKKV